MCNPNLQLRRCNSERVKIANGVSCDSPMIDTIHLNFLEATRLKDNRRDVTLRSSNYQSRQFYFIDVRLAF